MITKTDIQKEALDIVLPLRLCGIGLSMGVGKTLLGLKHMMAHYTDYAQFLVVAPTKVIISTWIAQAKEHGMECLLPHIKFTTYRSLSKQVVDYDVVYLDECHSLLYTHEPWLQSYVDSRPDIKILGLTGTPPKYPTGEKGVMVSTFCPIVFKYDSDEAITDNLLNDYEIILHPIDLETGKTLKIEKNGKVWFTSELASYDYWSDRLENAQSAKDIHISRIMRMKSIMTFPSKEKYAKKLFSTISDKCIIFANTQDQADRLCTNSFHSKNVVSEANMENFRQGIIKKLSAVLQLDQGANIPNLKVCIIMHAYGNERKASQRIGRMLRLSVDQKATVHILYYRNTVDEFWVKTALEDFDQDKIKHV